MLPVLLGVPAAIFAVKKVVKGQVSDAIANGIKEARGQILHTMLIYQTESIVKLFFNVILFLIATLLIPKIFSKELAIMVVCSVYLVSIIEASISTIRKLPTFLQIAFEYKFNLSSFIYNQTYEKVLDEVYRETRNLSPLKKTMNYFFGDDERVIARRITSGAVSSIYTRVINIIIRIVLMFFAYLLIFRVLIAPFLMENATGLSIFKSAIYPIFYTLDYFFGTSLLGIIL